MQQFLLGHEAHVKAARLACLARCSERPRPGVVRQRGCASPPWRPRCPRPRLAVVPSELVYRPLEEVGPARAFRSQKMHTRSTSLRWVQTPRTPKITAGVGDSKAPECAQQRYRPPVGRQCALSTTCDERTMTHITRPIAVASAAHLTNRPQVRVREPRPV